MVKSTTETLLGSRPARTVAAHPRMATVLVLTVLMIAMGGTAAASESLATTFGEGVTKTGP